MNVHFKELFLQSLASIVSFLWCSVRSTWYYVHHSLPYGTRTHISKSSSIGHWHQQFRFSESAFSGAVLFPFDIVIHNIALYPLEQECTFQLALPLVAASIALLLQACVFWCSVVFTWYHSVHHFLPFRARTHISKSSSFTRSIHSLVCVTILWWDVQFFPADIITNNSAFSPLDQEQQQVPTSMNHDCIYILQVGIILAMIEAMMQWFYHVKIIT